MTTRKIRPPWQVTVAVVLTSCILGAGTGAVMNSRHGDAVDATFSVPAPVSGEDGAPR